MNRLKSPFFMMSFFGLLVVSSASQAQSLSPDQGCRFKGTSRLKLTSIAGSIQAEEEAMVEAREDAKKICRSAGWKNCEGNPQYSKIVAEYFSTLDQFKTQYSATVESSDCYQIVQEYRYRDDVEVASFGSETHFQVKPESWYKFKDPNPKQNLSSRSNSDDQCRPRTGRDAACESSGSSLTTGSTSSLQTNRNTTIPGDGDGTGRKRD